MVLKDKSYLYKKYKDFNEYIIAKRDKRIEDLAFQKEQNKVLERVRQREC